jgi:hypothetical protein
MLAAFYALVLDFTTRWEYWWRKWGRTNLNAKVSPKI